MIKYQTSLGVTVALNAESPNQRAKIVYGGDSSKIPKIKEFLEESCGAFGHLIGEVTTPIDLHYVFSTDQAQQFKPSLIEGEEIVKNYDPGIPDGAAT